MASSTGTGKHNAKLIGSKQVQSLQGNTYIDHRTHRQVPARRGRGTPPTKMVFLGSKGWEPSITKSLSFRFHGRIWTCKYPEEKKLPFALSPGLLCGLGTWKLLAAYMVWISTFLQFSLHSENWTVHKTCTSAVLSQEIPHFDKQNKCSSTELVQEHLRQVRWITCTHRSSLTGKQTHRLVFDGGAGDTEVQLAILLNAGINQSLHRALVLKQQESISWERSDIQIIERPVTGLQSQQTFSRNVTLNRFDWPFGGK